MKYLIITFEIYSISQSFSKLLCNDMSRVVWHDIHQGCSRFSCDILYTCQDGTKSIAAILFEYSKNRKFQGTIYRGVCLDKDFSHLEVNKLIMSNTFLSTKSDEDEVLILPYSAFKIKNKEVIFDSKHQGKRIEFQFEEWDETSSNTNSLPTIYSFFLYNFNNLIFFLINLT